VDGGGDPSHSGVATADLDDAPNRPSHGHIYHPTSTMHHHPPASSVRHHHPIPTRFQSFVGFVFMLVVLGIVVDLVRGTCTRYRELYFRIIERDHIVILGWNGQTLFLIQEICKMLNSAGIPPARTYWWVGLGAWPGSRQTLCVSTGKLTHSLTHTHSHSLTHPFTRSLTRSVTHSSPSTCPRACAGVACVASARGPCEHRMETR
jgi:hypothetical protein